MNAKAIIAGLAIVALSACSDEPAGPAAAPDDPEFLALTTSEVALAQTTPRPGQLRRLYRQAKRTDLGGGIAHYEFTVPLGERPYDRVRIHRVVQERSHRRPIKTQGAVFMAHGASLDFNAVFLNAGATNPDHGSSSAIYLAANGIDVWGMDFAWTLVPQSTNDFGFMADWGLERDVEHTLGAMSVARIIRGLTRQGFGPMHLLGYSYGVGVAYAAAGQETRERRRNRHIRGLIPVDQAVKFSDPAAIDWACQATAARQGMIGAGMYQDPGGLNSSGLGHAALSDPTGVSPFPGLNNAQAANFIGARTAAVQALPTADWHFVGGSGPDAGGIPELLYTDDGRWAQFLSSLPPYMPVLARLESTEIQCNKEDSPLDDFLGDIGLPILYIGAKGAIGDLGFHTGGLTTSTDVTNHTVSVGTRLALTDYGHADLFLSSDAPRLVWDPIARWLTRRVEQDGRDDPKSREN